MLAVDVLVKFTVTGFIPEVGLVLTAGTGGDEGVDTVRSLLFVLVLLLTLGHADDLGHNGHTRNAFLPSPTSTVASWKSGL
jgi:hypothetical protein